MESTGENVKVYRQKGWRRAGAIFFTLCGSFIFIGSCWGAIAGWADPKPMTVFFSAAFAVVGAIWTVNAFQSTVTLSKDKIELRNISGTMQLPLNGIRGRREIVARGGGPGAVRNRYLNLIPDDDRLPTLEFEKYFTFDEAFFQWFYSLPDLDAMDKVKHKDADFGLV